MMKSSFVKTGRLAACLIVLLPVLHWSGSSQAESIPTKPLVLTVRIEAGKPVYKLNGKEVEDRRNNSLLWNLTEVVRERGAKIPVVVVIDVRAPLTEFGKMETALDKADLTSDRRLFVGDFSNGTMNEIHWDDKALRIPRD